MALDELFGKDTGGRFEVVNVLSEVGKEFVFLLKEADERVSWGVSVRGREDVLGDGVEDCGIFAENADVKYFLGVAEAEMGKLGVEAGVLGAEVRDAEAG